MTAHLNMVVRGMARTPEMEGIVHERFTELAMLDSRMSECRVLIERTGKYRQSGNPFRVIINIRLHSTPNVVVRREPNGMAVQDPLHTTLRNAFTIAKRKIVEASDQKQQVRTRPQAEYGAVISRIFRKKGYGFLVTNSGRSIFFHRNSVVGDEFDLLEEGTGVWFIEREGEKGPWASTVRICPSAS